MAAFILDASVTISWCFPGDPTEDSTYSRRILERLASNEAVVPEVWAFEIANSIFVSYSKRSTITEEQIQEYLALLKALPIRVEPSPSGSTLVWSPWRAVAILRPMTPLISTWHCVPAFPSPRRMTCSSRQPWRRASF
jgi:hypothetical protein